MFHRQQRRRRLPPKPPAGYMFYYRKLRRVADVQREAKRRMAGFDDLPRTQRDAENYDDFNRPFPEETFTDEA